MFDADCPPAAVGVAVTPLPQMLTEPVRSAVSTGQVMSCVGSGHTSHVTTVVTKSGGTAGVVQIAWSPVQTSWMV